jgi:periplasmic glucans biosynthesis protein
MNRREFTLAAAGSVLGAMNPRLSAMAFAQEAEATFSRATVVEAAKKLAEREHRPPARVPEPFSQLGYDQYRDIQFRGDRSFWIDEKRGFALDLLHAGFIYEAPVEINVVEDGVAKPVTYDPGLFDFAGLPLPSRPGAPLFSGIRLRYPINSPGYLDEAAVFQGGSYFRSLGEGQVYGVSARGLAIDTGSARGEEFPFFRTFWVERPLRSATTARVHALLDSPRVTGAFSFHIMPGHSTLMDVEATLFAREDVEHLGLAPLTSMYLFDSIERRRFSDYREAVHDSDTLVVSEAGGGWAVRPLANPQTLQMSALAADNVRGFGLQQRAVSYGDFKDLEAKYELRPSTWVEPKADWGEGRVELVEIPTDREFNDNIVAYWRPARTLRRGESLSYAYWLRWGRPVTESGLARVKETNGGLTLDQTKRLFVVDFAAPLDMATPGRRKLASYFPDRVKPEAWASAGTISNVVGYPNRATGGYRVSFELDVGGVELSELRLVLLHRGGVVSETWLYRWTG